MSYRSSVFSFILDSTGDTVKTFRSLTAPDKIVLTLELDKFEGTVHDLTKYDVERLVDALYSVLQEMGEDTLQ